MKVALRSLLVLLAACAFLAVRPACVQAQSSEGVPDYYHVRDTVASDFEQRFRLEDDRQNFARLQSYLNEREVVSKALKGKWDEYSSRIAVLRDSLSFETVRLRQMRLVVGRRGDSTSEGSRMSGALVEQRALEVQYTQDSIECAGLVIAREHVSNSISNVERDLNTCRQTINEALSVETAHQAFKSKMSMVFAILVALVIGCFFVLIRFGQKNIPEMLLGDGGLQFITLFVLIIAIILFGILGVLEGKELAAILSGIAGYILGRSTNFSARRRAEAESDAAGSSPADAPAGGTPE